MTTSDATRPTVDFDLLDSPSRAKSDGDWEALLDGGCPVAWSEHNGGMWVVSSYDAIAAVFRDWERFSSERFDPDRCAISFSTGKVPLMLPEEADPPRWYDLRRALAVILSPQAAERLRPRARYWAHQHLDRVCEQGHADLVDDLTVPVPSAVVMEWMGFPEEEWDWFRAAFHGVPAFPNGSPERRAASEAYGHVLERIVEEIADRRVSPRDDILTVLAHHEIDGEIVPDEIAHSLAFITLTGGVDTTTSLTGAAIAHLATHPADRQRLLDDPGLLATATEEFLRFYPPARTHARTVAVDTEFEGVSMKRGERVCVSEVAAGRDEAAFPDARAFVIDRNPNRHLSFGVGIHRCPGSHLARVEFTEMMTALLERMPDFAIDPAAIVEYPDWSMAGGYRNLPTTFTPSAPRGLSG